MNLEAMISLLLSWLDKRCAVLNILCHKILCQSVDTCVPRLALGARACSWCHQKTVKNYTSISSKLQNRMINIPNLRCRACTLVLNQCNR